MGRRSPSNERYQKHTTPAGKTRRSAAAAKPKRAAGGAPTKSSAKKVRPKREKMAYFHPTTPEYKRLRLTWWVFLGGAMVLSTASYFMWKSPVLKDYGTYVLMAAYASIAFAIYLDWSKLRPLRKEWIESGRSAAEKDVADKKS
jgi:hypothetical protein